MHFWNNQAWKSSFIHPKNQIKTSFKKRHNTTPLRLPTTQVCIGIGDVLKIATVGEVYTGKHAKLHAKRSVTHTWPYTHSWLISWASGVFVSRGSLRLPVNFNYWHLTFQGNKRNIQPPNGKQLNARVITETSHKWKPNSRVTQA